MNYQELSQYAITQEWAAKRKVHVDAHNLEILAERQKGLDARAGVGVGDFVLDGDSVLRVAHVWSWDDAGTPESIQLTDGRFGASFYLGKGGYVEMSGGLNPGITPDRFERTDERREGSCWFFSEDYATGHNGYHTAARFRVWKLRAE